MKLVTICAAFAITIAGCKKKEENTETKKVTPEPMASSSSAPEVKPKPDDMPKAKMELTKTADEKFGTLPEGIGLAVGTKAPVAAGKNLKGEETNLDTWIGKEKVALIFYRGGWCPYCNLQVRELTQNADAFKTRGITPILISVDSPEAGSKTQAQYTIPFPVLSDSELAIHKAYNVTTEVPEDKVSQLKSMGVDLEKASGQDHHTIAVPSVFIIDEKGAIIWAHADTDYKTRPSAEQLLAGIDSLGKAPGAAKKEDGKEGATPTKPILKKKAN